jgi:hypothetical protein
MLIEGVLAFYLIAQAREEITCLDTRVIYV